MKVQCPGCRNTYEVSDAAAGRQFQCNVCGVEFVAAPAKPPQVRMILPWKAVIAGVFIGAVCSSCLWLGCVSTPPASSSGPLYCGYVFYDWRSEPEKAAKAYLGKRFTIYGTVKAREEEGRVLLLSDLTRMTFSARCVMRPDDQDRLRSIGFHGLVEIRGTCRGPLSPDRNEIVFDDCELITAQAGEWQFGNLK